MDTVFTQAVRSQMPLKMVIDGPAGSGKTYTALRLAMQLGTKVCVIDTQYGSASLYAGEVVDGKAWDFQIATLPTYTVEWYKNAILVAERMGADVIIIDSLSSVWDDNGGILDSVEQAKKQRDRDGNAMNPFSAWKVGDKQYKELVRIMLKSPCHIIATLRVKTDYTMEVDASGKTQVKKHGLKPVQRDGFDYEFDLGFSMNIENVATVTKTHISVFPMGEMIPKPGPETAQKLLEWMRNTGEKPHVQIEQAGKLDVPASEQTEQDITASSIPDQPPEHTQEEIAAMREKIKLAVTSGTLSKERFLRWKADHHIGMRDAMSDMHCILLFGDLEVLEKTGQWRPTPF